MRDRAGCHDGARGGSTITGLGTARIEEGAYSRPKPQLLRDLLELLKATPTETTTIDVESGRPGDTTAQPEITACLDSGKRVDGLVHTSFEGREIRDPGLLRQDHPGLATERFLLRKEQPVHRLKLALTLSAFDRHRAG